MAFERLPPPIFAPIRKPTQEEIAEVSEKVPNLKAEYPSEWPKGTQCECKRNRKDGSKCGHVWKTRTPGKPNACAKCKQTCWDEEPTQRKRHKIIVKRKRASKKEVG